MFAIITGLRRSNVTDLEWSQVDLDKRMAWMHPDETKARSSSESDRLRDTEKATGLA